MNGISIFFAVFVVCLFSFVTGYRSYQHQIPNGDKVQHPCRRGRFWPTVGHRIPVRPTPGRPQLNLFGQDWRRSGYNWTAVCPLDSDNDGLTNGQELGDPDCVWQWGRTIRSQPIGHPGFCDEGRRQCSTNDIAIETTDCDHLKSRFRRVRPGGRTSRPRGQQQQQPPAIGNDHPQTHLTKWGRISGMSGQPGFRGPSSFSMPGAQVPGMGFPGAGSSSGGRVGQPHIPGMSSIPEMPGDPGMSGFPGMSGASGMSGISRMSGVSGMSGVPGMSGGTGMSGFPGMSGGSGASGIPGMLRVPGMSGDPRMSGASQTSPGLDRMVGMSVFGSSPRQGAMFPMGQGTFFPGSASRVSSPSFFGASSGLMGQVPSFFRGPVSRGGASPADGMGTAHGRMASESIGGVVSRTPGMRMRFPSHVTSLFGSSPIGMRMPGTEGRLSGTSDSARSALGAYRGRM